MNTLFLRTFRLTEIVGIRQICINSQRTHVVKKLPMHHEHAVCMVCGCFSSNLKLKAERLNLNNEVIYPRYLHVLSRKTAAGNTGCQGFASSSDGTLDQLTYESLAEETLQNLFDFFEQIGDNAEVPADFDVTYSSGVLTVQFGPEHGTYVINKQMPNKQIWLSSPTSGPKRYDFVNDDWVYSHDGIPMHRLLSEEISKIVGKQLDFYKFIKIEDT